MAMLTNDEITAKALDRLECELGPAAHTTRKYEGLFGPASVEVCRDAVKTLIPDMAAADVPDVLR